MILEVTRLDARAADGPIGEADRPSLFPSGPRWLTQADEVPARRARTSGIEVGHPVDCPVGCRGTMLCLCGQGELSDNPLWIEND